MEKFRFNYREPIIRVLIIVGVCITGLCIASTNFVTRDKLIKTLNTGNIDNILDVLNDIKAMQYQGEILPVIKDLWGLKLKKYHLVRPDIVSKDIVRMQFANIIMQAYDNHLLQVNTKSIHKYVKPKLDSSDIDLKNSAILTVMLFDDKTDVPKLVEIAKNHQQYGTFRIAIYALAYMCNKAASKALTSLESQVSSNNKAYIKMIIKNLDSLGLCNLK